jgi:NAD(P)-dependent dehydrogenase (short-subunit alcohol dehydrogenase family)
MAAERVCPGVMQVFVAGASGGSGKKAVQQLTAKGVTVRAGVRVSQEDYFQSSLPECCCITLAGTGCANAAHCISAISAKRH